MQVGLVCSDKLYDILKELLSNKNIDISEQSDLYLIEAGYDIPHGKLTMVFEAVNLHLLIEILVKLSKSGDKSNIVIGKSDDKYEIMALCQILFFEARGNYVYCITANGEYKIKEKLYELEKTLTLSSFIRISKSFVVNITNVKEIIPWFGRRLVLRFNNSKIEIEVSKNYVKSFKEFLGI